MSTDQCTVVHSGESILVKLWMCIPPCSNFLHFHAVISKFGTNNRLAPRLFV